MLLLGYDVWFSSFRRYSHAKTNQSLLRATKNKTRSRRQSKPVEWCVWCREWEQHFSVCLPCIPSRGKHHRVKFGLGFWHPHSKYKGTRAKHETTDRDSCLPVCHSLVVSHCRDSHQVFAVLFCLCLSSVVKSFECREGKNYRLVIGIGSWSFICTYILGL